MRLCGKFDWCGSCGLWAPDTFSGEEVDVERGGGEGVIDGKGRRGVLSALMLIFY